MVLGVGYLGMGYGAGVWLMGLELRGGFRGTEMEGW